MTSPQAPNMSSVLNRPSNTIERPTPLPPGTYRWQVKGQPRFDVSKNKNKFCEFVLTPLEAGEDVDATALKETLTVKATGELRPLAEKQMKPQFYYEREDGSELYGAALLKEFVDHCGVENPEASLLERIPGCAGAQILGHVSHTPSQDGKGMRADIDTFGPVQ